MGKILLFVLVYLIVPILLAVSILEFVEAESYITKLVSLFGIIACGKYFIHSIIFYAKDE